MDCKEFKGLIHGFLHDELDENMLAQFLEHIDGCSDCRDELRIQYLIYEGLERLESGETFDVDRDLAKVMEQQNHRLNMRRGLQKTAIAIEIMTMAVFTIVVGVVLFYQ